MVVQRAGNVQCPTCQAGAVEVSALHLCRPGTSCQPALSMGEQIAVVK